MEKRIFVKWGLTDDYGRAKEENAYFNWFETQEQADKFIAKKKELNDAYFYLWKVAEGDFTKYQYLLDLLNEIEQLKQEF